MSIQSAKQRVLHVGFCVMTAALLLLFASQCSPLYPINLWGDANCLLTVGRVMRSGGILYRDIYEQKGPTLYLLHAAAAAISENSFLGVYLLEVLSLSLVLLLLLRLLRGRVPLGYALPSTALFGAWIVISGAFSRGDSAEEFCLPLLLCVLVLAYESWEHHDEPMCPRSLFLCGLLAGGVASIKYTLLGQVIGLCLCEGVLALRQGGLRRAVRSAGVFLCGMLLPILLWGIYFAIHGALADAVTAYLYNNIFLYGETTVKTGLSALKDAARMFLQNIGWALPTLLGLVLTLFNRTNTSALRGAMLVMGLGQCVTVFLLGRVWTYSPLVFSVFGVLGLLEIGRRGQQFLAEHDQKIKASTSAVCGVLCCVLALCMGWFLTPNVFLRGETLDNLAQGRLAGYVEPGATLLQYSHLDDGLYLTADVLPQEKYFVRLNVGDEDMKQALDEAVREGRPDYVLVTWRELPPEFDLYQLIAVDAGYDEDNRINKAFYLYRRKNG